MRKQSRAEHHVKMSVAGIGKLLARIQNTDLERARIGRRLKIAFFEARNNITRQS